MVKKEWGILVKAMKAVYADPKFLPDEYSTEVWFRLVKDIDYKDAENAIQKHMASSPYPPTIADIRRGAAELANQTTGDVEIDALTAWAMVRKATQNSNYHAEEEFEKLPLSVQQAVGNPNNLKEWAAMDSESFDTVEQSHFVRSYRSVLERKKTTDILPPSLQQLYKTAIPEKEKMIEYQN